MIGGFIPCSFIDYPGCLSAVVFLSGCNLRCPYCHNQKLLCANAPSAMTKDELFTFLHSRRGRLEGIVFSGGEPTLHPELRSLIEVARSFGFKVKLDTNGTRSEVLSELLDAHLLDYIALDLKDEPAAYPAWLRMQGAPEVLLTSLNLVKYSGVDHELRTTVVWPYHNEKRLSNMAKWTVGCKRWYLQPCTPTMMEACVLRPPSERTLDHIAKYIYETYGINCRCRTNSNKGTVSHETM